ncbi:MAG: hypothetical protein AB7H92_14070 [Microbacteriaceae bacterium]
MAEVLGALNKAREVMVGCRAWRRLGARVGFVGMVRSLEVTCSEQGGWHPHEHALVLVDRPLDHQELGRWWLDVAALWHHEVGKVNAKMAPSRSPGVGVDVRSVQAETVGQVAAYVVGDVGGVALELARGDTKLGRGEGSQTPWQLLDRATRGDRWADRRWAEYCAATRGRARIRWTKNLRARLRLGREQSDLEAAEDTSECEPVCDLDEDESAVVLAVPELQPRVCEAAEAGGADAVHEYLGRVLGELLWRDRVALRRWARDRTRMKRRADDG